VILVVGVNGTGQDDDDRQARAKLSRARRSVARRRGGHVPRRGRGAARDLGRARGRGLRRLERGGDPAAVAYDAIDAARRAAATS
jgi:hypothetical protein